MPAFSSVRPVPKCVDAFVAVIRYTAYPAELEMTLPTYTVPCQIHCVLVICSRRKVRTRHVVTTRDFLDWCLASRTHNSAALNLGQTCLFLFMFVVGAVLLVLFSLIVARTGFVVVERDVVNSTDAKAASHTCKDVCSGRLVVNIPRWATLYQTVAEVWVGAEAVGYRQVLESIRKSAANRPETNSRDNTV